MSEKGKARARSYSQLLNGEVSDFSSDEDFDPTKEQEFDEELEGLELEKAVTPPPVPSIDEITGKNNVDVDNPEKIEYFKFLQQFYETEPQSSGINEEKEDESDPEFNLLQAENETDREEYRTDPGVQISQREYNSLFNFIQQPAKRGRKPRNREREYFPNSATLRPIRPNMPLKGVTFRPAAINISPNLKQRINNQVHNHFQLLIQGYILSIRSEDRSSNKEIKTLLENLRRASVNSMQRMQFQQEQQQPMTEQQMSMIRRQTRSSYSNHQQQQQSFFPLNQSQPFTQGTTSTMQHNNYPNFYNFNYQQQQQQQQGYPPPQISQQSSVLEIKGIERLDDFFNSMSALSLDLINSQVFKTLTMNFADVFSQNLMLDFDGPRIKRGRLNFSPAEDRLLAIGVERYGTHAWEKIRETLLPTKTVQQLINRYKNRSAKRAPDNPIKNVSQKVKNPLTPEEQMLLREGIRIYGYHWELISQSLLPHRNARTLKKFWLKPSKATTTPLQLPSSNNMSFQSVGGSEVNTINDQQQQTKRKRGRPRKREREQPIKDKNSTSFDFEQPITNQNSKISNIAPPPISDDENNNSKHGKIPRFQYLSNFSNNASAGKETEKEEAQHPGLLSQPIKSSSNMQPYQITSKTPHHFTTPNYSNNNNNNNNSTTTSGWTPSSSSPLPYTIPQSFENTGIMSNNILNNSNNNNNNNSAYYSEQHSWRNLNQENNNNNNNNNNYNYNWNKENNNGFQSINHSSTSFSSSTTKSSSSPSRIESVNFECEDLCSDSDSEIGDFGVFESENLISDDEET